jgi:predicted anti-sigma-YlaC factor YlaD
MSCRDVVELVNDYLDGALDDERRVHVEAHLGDCDGCSRVLDQLRETLRLTGLLTEERLTPAQRHTLLGAFRAHHAG